jgi:hypothetical protein
MSGDEARRRRPGNSRLRMVVSRFESERNASKISP